MRPHRREVALPPARRRRGPPCSSRPQARVVARPGRRGHRLEPPPRLRRGGRASARTATSRRPIRIATAGSRRGDGPVEDRPDVVVLALEPVEPAPLVGAGQLGGRRLRERHVPVAMAGIGSRRSRRGLEPLGGVLADRVEQPEARLAVGRLLDPDQALVGERHEAVEDVAADLGRRAADGLGRLEVAAAGEDRQPVEQPPARARRAGRSSRRSRRAASAAAPAGRGRRRPGRRADARAGPGSPPARGA